MRLTQIILRTALVSLLAIVFSQSAYADLSRDDFQDFALRGTPEQKQALEMYIGGVGKGYLFASLVLDKQALFCSDGNITTKDFYEMTLEAIRLRKKDHGKKDGDTPIELVLLQHLIKFYPCKR